MPSHVKNVRQYKDSQPVFTRYGIESQLDAMFSPIVQLRSGGYIVINQAEALVAIDVNSGRATREHHIEDTALKTNVEAAEEIARQLRLRDLAGLIVIDFIDMDETRNNRQVERRLKEALKNDRARIQVGRISHFGLLEMSRQRIRSSVLESSTEKCPICGGSGHVRSVSSVALQCLRALEEMLIKGATHNLIVRTRSEVALYMLNHKRAHLGALEQRFRVSLTISADPTVSGQQSYVIDRGEQVHSAEEAKSLAAAARAEMATGDDFADDPVEDAGAESEDATDIAREDEAAPAAASNGEGERDSGRRRRRRGRGRGRGRGEPREGQMAAPHDSADEHTATREDHEAGSADEESGEPSEGGGFHTDAAERPDGARRRRRGRRGGRRNRGRRGHGNGNGEAPMDAAENGGQSEPHHDNDSGTFESPYSDNARAYTPPAPPESEPAQQAASGDGDTPRRRSTVREPAQFSSAAAPPSSPPPAPVISSTAAEETSAPKRGWWGKRLLGDKD
jgi:ribonuclease E